jgi:hypothetical protein
VPEECEEPHAAQASTVAAVSDAARTRRGRRWGSTVGWSGIAGDRSGWRGCPGALAGAWRVAPYALQGASQMRVLHALVQIERLHEARPAMRGSRR